MMIHTKNLYLSFLLTFVLFSLLEITLAIPKPYIVYFGGHPHGPNPSTDDIDRAESCHHDFLASFLGSKEKARDSIIYGHTKHINAFSAQLEEEEAEKISKHPDVISIFESESGTLQTTHVWEFLGLEKNGEIIENSLWKKANLGEDIILANFDAGIWPESKSFSEEGLNLGPIPSRWQGKCTDEAKDGITCNKKLISARKFYGGLVKQLENTPVEAGNPFSGPGHIDDFTARDYDGHGTHTLSTAGGAFVAGVNSFGFGNGTIKGGAPRARLASYKVCWPVSRKFSFPPPSDMKMPPGLNIPGLNMPPSGMKMPPGLNIPGLNMPPSGLKMPPGLNIPGLNMPPADLKMPPGLNMPPSGMKMPPGLNIPGLNMPPADLKMPPGLNMPPSGMKMPPGLNIPGLNMPPADMKMPPGLNIPGLNMPPSGMKMPPGLNMPPIGTKMPPGMKMPPGLDITGMMKMPVTGQCDFADRLAAFEEAIHDGADVLSISLINHAKDFMSDSNAIGALHAVKKGMVVVAAAGNKGPAESTVDNLAPWIITVGASTMDREFTTYVQLGDNKQLRLKGYTLSEAVLPEDKLYPLINAVDAKMEHARIEDAKACNLDTLNSDLVKGKIVVCVITKGDVVGVSMELKNLGAVGLISFDEGLSGEEVFGMPSLLPTAELSPSDGKAVLNYLSSTKSPMAYIEPGKTELNAKPAPRVGAFSNRGPNVFVPEILKPDIIAPGVHIIAAVPPVIPLTKEMGENRRANYTSWYGTSMATPVVAGVAALLKAAHRDWSPAAIKSAIMTTANVVDNTNQPIRDYNNKVATPFSRGAGHINPNKAMDPGLVYDLAFEDYLNFLCGMGFNKTQISTLAGNDAQSFECLKSYNLLDFNYPAITVPNLVSKVPVKLSRKLKNVGCPGTYKVEIVTPAGVTILVNPKTLKFEKEGEEKVFTITLKAEQYGAIIGNYSFGSLTWNDGVHTVTSPIAVKQAATNPAWSDKSN